MVPTTRGRSQEAGRRKLRGAEPWLALTEAVLESTPSLPGARCLGRSELFDGETEADRDQAAAICRRCPAQKPCRDWRTATTNERTRPVGVLAGRCGGGVHGHDARQPEGGTLEDLRQPRGCPYARPVSEAIPRKGQLRPDARAPVSRILPTAEGEPLARWFWVPEWDLPEGAVHEALTLPFPACQLVVEADAVVKGQTASSSYKPAILDNGVRIMVPPHIGSGTRIIVDVY